jgi:hypothetical protein
MRFFGVIILLFAGSLWIFGGRKITRRSDHRSDSSSLISRLRPSPISLKDFTPTQKRHMIWLLVATGTLIVFGLALTEGAFD